MSRTKNFLYNSISAAAYQIVLLIIGFIIPKIMMETYGSELNGLISSITQFINYFNLVEAGLSGAAVYALYMPLAHKNYKKISAIVNATNQLYCKSGFLFTFLLFCMSIIYPNFVKSEKINYVGTVLLIIILGASSIIEFFTLGKYRALLTANQKLYVISIASIIYQVLSTIIIIILAKYRISIVIVRAISLLAVFTRTFILYFYVKINYHYLDKEEKPEKEALNKRWDAFYLNVLGAIHSGVPIMLATFFTNLVQVSIFGVYNMILNGLGGVVGIFTNGLSSSFGDIIAKDERGTLIKAYNEFEYLYYSIITLLYSICITVILPFVKIYTWDIKDANYCIPSIAFLITLNGLLYNLKTPQGMLVISAGHYKETKLQTTIQGSIAVVFGIILAPKWGLQGILLGSIASNLYRNIDLMLYVPKKILKISFFKTMKRMFLVIFEVGIIKILFSFITVNLTNYLTWTIYSIFVALCSGLVILIFTFLFEKDTLNSILNRIQYSLNRKNDV